MARDNAALTDVELRQLAKRFFNETLAKAEHSRLSTRLPRNPVEGVSSSDLQVDHLSEVVDRFQDELDHNNFVSAKEALPELASYGVPLPPDGSPGQTKLSQLVLRALLDAYRVEWKRAAGELDAGPTDTLFIDAPARASDPFELNGTPDTVNHVLQGYIAECSPSWKERTVEKYKSNLATCIEIIGPDTPIGSINRASVREVKAIISALPAHWKTKYPNSTAKVACEAAKAAKDEAMSPANANAYLTALSGFLSWSTRNGYLETDIASGMKVPDPVKAKDKRYPYSVDQLRIIFSAPLFTGMKSSRKWQKPGDSIERNCRFWLPLVGLWTGMRLGEVLALKRQHFIRDDGVDVIAITDAKTEAGIRKIPVPQALLNAGLMQHVEGVTDDSFVFPNFTQKHYSKFYRRFQKSIGLEDPKLVFHSFRHTFTDALRAAETQEPVMKALLGHSDGTVTSAYGKGYPTAVLKTAIDRVSFPELDLRHLNVR